MIAGNLVLDEPTIQRLKSHDLIWDAVVTDINETEMKNCERVWKYLEHLMRTKLDRNVFKAFCEFLDEENPWISSELRVELTLEKGQLRIDEYIKNEVSTLVHRYFGTSKRISENEKKQVEELLAMRTQCTKNIWIKNVEQTKQSLIAQISFERQRSNVQRSMISKIMEHLQHNKELGNNSSNSSFSEDTLTEKEAYRWMNTENNLYVVKTLEGWVDKLMDSSTNTQNKLELMKEEKERTVETMGDTMESLGSEMQRKPNGVVRLDKEMNNMVKKFDATLNEVNTKLDETKKHCQELEEKLDETTKVYENELKERDRHIRFLADNLERTQGDASQKTVNLDMMDENLGEANDKITTLEEKVKYWERYRHYGYWYARNSGNMDEGIHKKQDSGTKSKVTSSRKSTNRGKKEIK